MAMSFIHPAAYSTAVLPLRNYSLPDVYNKSLASPAPKSAPVMPSEISLARRNNPPTRHVKPKQTIAGTGDISSVNAEIERLSALCDEHERRIRTSRASIEHRLFTDLPPALTRLNELDDNAESITAQIHATINSISPILSDKLSAILSARKKDVETMRQRTTPWKRFFEESADKQDASPIGGIKRIQGAGTNDADELLRIERWAEEVEMFLVNDIASLRQQLAAKNKRSARIKMVTIMFISLVVALWMYISQR